jgi:hypothetical protein
MSWIRLVLAWGLLAAALPLAAQDIERGVGTWDAQIYGNHRFVVDVAASAPAVRATIPWRRRDAHPDKVAVLITAESGHPVLNAVVERSTREVGSLVFEPLRGAGRYFVYTQPFHQLGRANYPTVLYLAPQDTADAGWRRTNGIDDPARRQKLPEARVLRYEAASAFDTYTDMELAATQAEKTALLAANPHADFLLFPEDRVHPVRMFDDIPLRWTRRGAGGAFEADVRRDEYLSFQIGLWAARKAISNVGVTFEDLRGPGDARIPAAASTCFNLGGIDYAGQAFTKKLDVAASRVQPLWMGIAIPATAVPGTYRGVVHIAAAGGTPRQIPLVITVGSEIVSAHGDDDPYALTRLRWLDSTLAQDDELVKPYTEVRVDGARLSILGRDVVLGGDGLPAQIESRFDERVTHADAAARALLAAPMRLLVEDDSGIHALAGPAAPVAERVGPARVRWQSQGEAGPLQESLRASLEADGTLSYAIALTATRATKLRDIRLEIPLASAIARYELGFGRTGDHAPDDLSWKWNVENNQDGAWLGDVDAGLEFHLRDERYARPLNTNFYHERPLLMPRSWDNGGRGGVTMKREADAYRIVAFSGPREMKGGETLRYDLVLRITPFKPIKPAEHFAERYFHRYAPLAEIKAKGANVANIHHATPINPWINYPFLEPAKMRTYIDDAHGRGMRVKIYDTIRELSNHAPELPMLESLGHEVLSPGRGGGFSWLQEHLDGDYIAAWFVPEIKDAAVIDAGQSRWHNYYIEGLAWLARNVGLDGLYLDDVAYDRTTMKRVRKVLERDRPAPLIDLHSANQFNPRDGHINSALLYMELFPYLDRLWFGEEFDYGNTSPQYWLTEMSGIPFGLMGEMLQDDGNPWRGMLFGMTSRLGWSAGSDPRALWKAWDDFGIEKADMIGWWVHDTPVKTDHPDVLATSYVRDGKTLVAVASWATQKTEVKLAVDWNALRLDPARARLRAPAIDGFQSAASFRPGDTLPVLPGKGWLLILE